MSDKGTVHELSAHIVELVWENKGVSKRGKNYTSYSLLLVPFKGDDVVVNDDEKVWVSCGFQKPWVNKGDYVNVIYQLAGDNNQYKNMIEISHVDQDKPYGGVVANDVPTEGPLA